MCTINGYKCFSVVTCKYYGSLSYDGHVASVVIIWKHFPPTCALSKRATVRITQNFKKWFSVYKTDLD